MRLFSSLSDKERFTLGRDLGDRLLGTADYAEDRLEVLLEVRQIEGDINPLDDPRFCDGLEDVAVCCCDCGRYTQAGDTNWLGICDACAEVTEEE